MLANNCRMLGKSPFKRGRLSLSGAIVSTTCVRDGAVDAYQFAAFGAFHDRTETSFMLSLLQPFVILQGRTPREPKGQFICFL